MRTENLKRMYDTNCTNYANFLEPSERQDRKIQDRKMKTAVIKDAGLPRTGSIRMNHKNWLGSPNGAYCRSARSRAALAFSMVALVLAMRAIAASPAPEILTPKALPMPRIKGPSVLGVRPGHPVLYTIPATGDRPMTFG